MKKLKQKVTSIRQTSPMCPSQWELQLKGGDYMYVRYRHGILCWGVGQNMDAALRDSLSDDQQIEVGDNLDGFMATSEMMRHLGLERELNAN